MLKFCSCTLITVLIADLLATSGDFSVTWTSPVLPKLQSNDSDVNPLGRPITSNEASWIGSLLSIGSLIGPLLFGAISEKLGRKIALLSIAVPYVISYTILGVMRHVYWYYAARFLAGISVGAGYSILPLYIAEIAEDSNRGRLSVTLNTFWTVGDLTSYILGHYTTILSFNLTIACVPVLFFVLFLIVAPESPYVLIKHGKMKEAEEALMKLRSKSRSAVEKEIQSVKSTLDKCERGTFLNIFKTKANLKAAILSGTLTIFQGLSGISAIFFYTQFIFEMSGSNLPAEISSIVVGSVLFLTSWITPLFADNFGRKVFLIISSIVMMVSLAVLGTYFFLKENTSVNVNLFNWLPIVSLVSYIIGFNSGFASMTWTVSSELYPANMRATGTSIVSFIFCTEGFLITKFFNDFVDLFGNATIFWVFSFCCFVAMLFVIFCLPETRGKSFREIQDLLES